MSERLGFMGQVGSAVSRFRTFESGSPFHNAALVAVGGGTSGLHGLASSLYSGEPIGLGLPKKLGLSTTLYPELLKPEFGHDPGALIAQGRSVLDVVSLDDVPVRVPPSAEQFDHLTDLLVDATHRAEQATVETSAANRRIEELTLAALEADDRRRRSDRRLQIVLWVLAIAIAIAVTGIIVAAGFRRPEGVEGHPVRPGGPVGRHGQSAVNPIDQR